MRYLSTHLRIILMGILPCLVYNLYYIFLLPDVKMEYLIYLDFLIVVVMLFFCIPDIFRYTSVQSKKRELLKQDYIIYKEIQNLPELKKYAETSEPFEILGTDIAKHDVLILDRQLRAQFNTNCELQDYITGWCHEVKIPLSAALLMTGRIEDEKLKEELLEQLERMNTLLRSVLMGTKMQGSLFDLKVQKTGLMQCVKDSLHNNQYFLIKKHFSPDINVEGDVYTDPLWLTYVLDQLISNSIKYAKENPKLKIYTKRQDDVLLLCIEDNGEGIEEKDIRRIFEKGYVGSSYHNGQYKSTGMGLYMTRKILNRLGHDIYVKSEYGKGACFTIAFKDNREYFNL